MENKSKKQMSREIKSKKGKILFRKDMKLLEDVREQKEEYYLSRRVVELLMPLNKKMLDVIDDKVYAKFNERLKSIRGRTISKQQMNEIFKLSKAYERLSNMDYETKPSGERRQTAQRG